MNYYITITADETLKATNEEFHALEEALYSDCDEHGFELSFRDDELFLFAQEDGKADELPEDFLLLLGQLIKSNEREFLELGEAWTADRPGPLTFGGTRLRIYIDGSVEYPTLVWEREGKDA